MSTDSAFSTQPPPPTPLPPRRCALAICNAEIPRGAEYSFIITLATRGPDPRAGAFQCPPGDEIAAGNLDAQHFCCTIEHAAIAAHACIDEHIVPAHHDHLASLDLQ